jgi:hypothetical protein
MFRRQSREKLTLTLSRAWHFTTKSGGVWFGLRQGQPEMLDALVVLVEGDDIGDGLFMTLIVTDDELQFDTHRRASPGSSGR